MTKARSEKTPKLACGRGHEFTPENTRIKANGHRACRECLRRNARERRKARSTLPVAFDAAAFDAKHRIIDAPVKPCCARCMRGTRQFSSSPPCGDRGCPCHGPF